MKLINFFLVLCLSSPTSVFAAQLPSPVNDSDYYDNGIPDEAKVKLGNLLFFDKILSGNKNISCATCHSPFMTGGDGLSMGVGEGGRFLGPMRSLGEGEESVKSRVARNAPPLWNLGAKEFTKLNWQGVHQFDVDSGRLALPSGPATPDGLDNVLAGQVLFPVVNTTEMLGQPGDNEVIDASIGFPRGSPFLFPPQWEALTERLRNIPEYVSLFRDAFDDISAPQDMTFVHVANAIAAFETSAFRSKNSPFDKYLHGDLQALTSKQKRGLELFYDKTRNSTGAGCWTCHSGAFQTDHDFHSIAVPQMGPGVLPAPAFQDYGREEVTRNQDDRFKFKTPSLRNVAVTYPYGHNGAFATLKGMVKHHLNPISSLDTWDKSQVKMRFRDDLSESDFIGYDDLSLRQELADSNQLGSIQLTETQIDNLVEFLTTLTDPASLNMHWMIPNEVPSGLTVGD